MIGSEGNPIHAVWKHIDDRPTTPTGGGSRGSVEGVASHDTRPAGEDNDAQIKVPAPDNAAQPELPFSHEETVSKDSPTHGDKDTLGHLRSIHHHKIHHSRTEDFLRSWSWLSKDSPLMGSKSEAEWILDRLSSTLEHELHRQQNGHRQQPPIGLRHLRYKHKDEGSKSSEEDAKQSLGND